MVPDDKKLTYVRIGWSSHATMIPAYINFSQHCNKKLAFFYKDIKDYKGNMFPLCRWTILNKDPENADKVYEQIEKLSDFRREVREEVSEFVGTKFAPAEKEDLAQATDYVLYETGHSSRLIKREYLQTVKKILSSDYPDVVVCTMDDQGNMLDETEQSEENKQSKDAAEE